MASPPQISPHIRSLLHQALLSQQSLNDSLSLLTTEVSLLNASLSPSISTDTNHVISPFYISPLQWESHSPSNHQPPFHYHSPPTATNQNLYYHHDQPLPSSPSLPLSVASAPLYVSISTMGDAVTKKLQDVIEKPTGVETESVAKTDLMTHGDVVSPELVYATLLAPAVVGGKEPEQELIGETARSALTRLLRSVLPSFWSLIRQISPHH